EEVQACVRVARAHGRPFTPRGSGTGLAGGAVPVADPVVIVTTKMNRVLEVDEDERVAWVEPGVLNLDLTRAVSHLGLHYAPDPSSQQSCSVGGNVATNSGGPHCLLYGVTSAHVLAVEVVLVDGLPAGVDAAAEAVAAVGREHGARSVRVAADAEERALLWKGRKSAFGAIARIAPNYYLHDAVVPRTRLVEVLRRVYEIGARHRLVMMNVFHAGDGNLHPLIVFDRREPGVMERVLAAGTEIIEACVAAGGVLSGEHGIGLEKRDYMPLVFSPDDLDAQARLPGVFDPAGTFNLQQVLPDGRRCRGAQNLPVDVR